MLAPTRVLVVGSSVAGVRCVQSLRAEGYEGELVLIGAEAELPYDKPPLSKQFLAGTRDVDQVRLLTRDSAADLGVTLRLGSAASGLDADNRDIHLEDGSIVGYDAVVLATGAAARPPPWSAGSGVHVLRTLQDAQALRADLGTGGHLVVVGGGFIGAEVAATARALGHEVTIIDPLLTPIGRALGDELGARFARLHQRHGVDTRFGVGVASIKGQVGDLTVSLDDGTEVKAGAVVVGIGAVPNDAWLESSPLHVENGVLCDQFCRAVGCDDVYVVGDLARTYHLRRGEYVRVEHWTNAVESGVVAAHNIAHPDDLRVHSTTEYVWSDQYDWKIQIAGRPAAAVRHELIGSLEGAARAVALSGDESGALVGAVSVNWPKAMATARRLLGAGAQVDDARAQVGAVPPVRVHS